MHSPRKNPRLRVLAAGFAAVENQRPGHLRVNAGAARKCAAGGVNARPGNGGGFQQRAGARLRSRSSSGQANVWAVMVIVKAP